jgi:hypothetical protein
VARVEGHLLGLGKEVVGVAVEHQPADLLHRHHLLGNELGRIEQVEAERMLLVLRNHLHAELPFGEVAVLDGLPQVAAVKVRVLAGDLLRLVPYQAVDAELGLPVELHEVALAARVDEAEGVHAEAFHHAKAARNGAVAHGPHQHVGALGHERGEVPEGVVRARGLRHLVVRLGLDGVDEVGELHRVLDEEHRNVVAHEVVVALARVELDGKAAHVAHGVGRAARAGHGGEAHENGRLGVRVLQEVGAGELRHRLVDLEIAVRRRAARVHGALGNALVVEVRDLLAQDEVFEQRGSAQARLQRVVVVRYLQTLVGGEGRGMLDGEALELLLLGAAAVRRLGGAGAAAGCGLVLWRHRGPGIFHGEGAQPISLLSRNMSSTLTTAMRQMQPATAATAHTRISSPQVVVSASKSEENSMIPSKETRQDGGRRNAVARAFQGRSAMLQAKCKVMFRRASNP